MIDTSNYENDADYINALEELDIEFPLVKVLNLIKFSCTIPYGGLIERGGFSKVANDISDFRNKRRRFL